MASPCLRYRQEEGAPTKLKQAIKDELRKSLERLGGEPELLAAIDSAGEIGAVMAIARAAERLGADRFLLAIIGSYGDTMDDEEVLAALKDWNADRPFFDRLIGSVDPAGPWQGLPFPRRRRG